jgi:hypothetical protein
MLLSKAPKTRTSQVNLPQPPSACPWVTNLLCSGNIPPKLAAMMLAIGSLGLSGESAIAQVSINRDPNTGAVEIDRNAFNVETGPLTNTSNIPLPAALPIQTREGQALPDFVEGQLAPNSLNITTDYDYINRSFDDIVGQDGPAGPRYTLQRDSVLTTTSFDLNYVPTNHNFAEGIQVTVFNADGSVKSSETQFVRGDGVTQGPDGQPLPSSASISVTYAVDETVELRILNISSNDDPVVSQSGVYFTRDGQIIAEDLPDGGDKDFDDGEYIDLSGGAGEAVAVEERTDTTTETDSEETPLEPEIRREQIVESDEVVTSVETSEDVVEEIIERGEVAAPDPLSTRLGHAVGMRTETGELLVYDRYANTGELRAGSDGFSAAGQLAPLFRNPNRPPTLLSGSLNFNPWVDDNEAGFSGTVGLTQFLSRTHRQATDVFGNPIENPNPEGARPLEPTGLFNNRQMVGYVPGGILRDEPILSSNGIFELPQNQKIVIAPPDQSAVGRGDSAYTDNVGGLLIESTGGDFIFVPQWNKQGYAQTPLELEAGEASRVIYAMVPQQTGQNLQLNQTYAVDESAGNYKIEQGGFTIISADRYPENFYQEDTEVYTVEDTLPSGNNATTALFNGIRGVYVETPGGARVPTVDPNIPSEADARVGNGLFPDVVGQRPYARTTVAAGLYLGGSLTGGIGNQRDIVNRTSSTFETETDQRRQLITTNTFLTPVTQVDSTLFEQVTTTQTAGQAAFQVNSAGLLEQVTFTPTSDSTVVATNRRDLQTTNEVRRGDEVLDDSDTQESVEILGSRTSLIEQDSSVGSNSYANASPVSGEIALGGVLNFGNTPWTPAANVIRAELFARDTVFGRSADGSEAGWRAELLFHPFGEVRRDGYQYDEDGNVVALYQTEPKLDASGNQLINTLEAEDGSTIAMPVNQFVVDDAGDRVIQQVGTGRPKGPGVYVRVEDAWDDGDSAVVDGGIQFSF